MRRRDCPISAHIHFDPGRKPEAAFSMKARGSATSLKLLPIGRSIIFIDGSVGIKRRNKMLGLGLVGTILVILLVVWLVRRAV